MKTALFLFLFISVGELSVTARCHMSESTGNKYSSFDQWCEGVGGEGGFLWVGQ